MSLCVSIGVLEEAKFFGLSKAVEPLEMLVRVCYIALYTADHCSGIIPLCTYRVRSFLPAGTFLERNFFTSWLSLPPQPHSDVRYGPWSASSMSYRYVSVVNAGPES